jgi:hyperosmotically inducible periplasmic protein
MAKIMPLFLSSILLLGTAACGNKAKTSSNAPDYIGQPNEPLTDKDILANKKDATSPIRRYQLNADIRAREQRNDFMGGNEERTNNDLASEVRSKLEANIPSSQLTVAAENGAIIVAGTVENQYELNKIDALAREIKGVRSVKVIVKTSSSLSSQQQ